MTTFLKGFWKATEVILRENYCVEHLVFEVMSPENQTMRVVYEVEDVWYHNWRALDAPCRSMGMELWQYREIRARHNCRVREVIRR